MGALPEKRILVVSDDSEFIATLEKALGERYNVINSGSTDKKLKRKISELAPDVVIVDVAMPSLSGIDVSLHIRRFNAELPILVLSLWETKRNAVRRLDLTSETYLSAPVTFEELIEKIESILSR